MLDKKNEAVQQLQQRIDDMRKEREAELDAEAQARVCFSIVCISCARISCMSCCV